MGLYSFLFLLSYLFTVVISDSIPLHVSPGLNISVGPTGRLNCSDLHRGFSTTCFKNQKIADYLLNWNTSIRRETCAPSQIWSQCFQSTAYADPSIKNLPAYIASDHNCTLLTTNASNSHLCSKPDLNAKNWTQGDWYGVWNIYSLQMHISTWAQAITSNASQMAIGNITDGIPDYNASQVLETLVQSYGLNPLIDDALVSLLKTPRPNVTHPAAQYPSRTHGRVPAPSDKPSVRAWQPVLEDRLAEVLRVAMSDFSIWYKVIKDGSYSTAGFASAGQLILNMQI